MPMTRYCRLIRSVTGSLVAGAVLCWSAEVPWAWEGGTKIGFDTNINRSVDDEEADSYVTGYALTGGSHSGKPLSHGTPR